MPLQFKKKARKKQIFFSILLAFAISACNLPTTTPTSPADAGAEKVGTGVAKTMAAVETESFAESPTTAIEFTKTPTELTPTSTSTATMTPTPTYTLPMLKFEGDTNCRNGPGLSYEIIATYREGEKTEILGKHPSENFWVVKPPYGEGICWVTGEFTSVTGSHWAVPTMTPPPTNTPSPPTAPTLQEFNYTCNWDGSNTNMTMNMTWSDRAKNESGYRIYRNGTMIADLNANTTTYVDIAVVDPQQLITYEIEAYNPSGVSARATFSASCQ